MTTDDLAGLRDLLAEHHWDLSEWDLHSPLNLCTCGESIGNNEGDFHAHQAAVIADAGWRQGREEWATGIPTRGTHISITRHVSEDSARWRASQPETFGPLEVVRRYVTDWEKA